MAESVLSPEATTTPDQTCAQAESALARADSGTVRTFAAHLLRDHTALRDEERRWISERDYSCKMNGTTTDVACLVMKTATRADELESRIHF